MKLQVPFLQLPVSFDADALAGELAGVDESHWRPHPNNIPGNSALTLISAGGDPDNDSTAGAMRATPVLAQLPLLRELLAGLGATWGRSRLMRLSGQAEVTAHVDSNYYWRERMRVHVPIVTTPGVRFQVAEAEVNMAAGECWIFDTWSRHRVLNEGSATRIHLVADTVGGQGLWDLIARGRPPGHPIPGWKATPMQLSGFGDGCIDFENVNHPKVMSPYEIREIFHFLLSEAIPSPAAQPVQWALQQFTRRWQALWAAFGEDSAGHTRYQELIARGREDAQQRGAGQVVLRNGMNLLQMLDRYVFEIALANTGGAIAQRDVHGQSPPHAAGPTHRTSTTRLIAPVFIVSAPRSGSTLLFETLSAASGVFTVGDESHGLIEGIPSLAPGHGTLDSNRLDDSQATPEVAAHLAQRFLAALFDREGRPAGGSVRMLEKTPKNALRIPFLRAAFPGARFIYLHRDPRQVLASMIEGWLSGRFVTYPRLPDWKGPQWSFLLTPRWRELSGKPLADIVAAQWEITSRTLLDDLQALDPEEWIAVDHARFLEDPQATALRVSQWAGWDWDQELSARLPISRSTLTPPDPDKWRKHSGDIEPRLATLALLCERASRMVRSRE